MWLLGRFPFKKESGLLWNHVWKFQTCPMERYIPVAKTRPKPPRVWLLIQKSGTGDNNQGRGHFGPNDRNDTNGQSGPQIPVGPNRNGPFHLISNRNFRDFRLNLIGLIIKTLFQAPSRTRSLSEIVQDCNYLLRDHSKVACLLQLQPQGTEWRPVIPHHLLYHLWTVIKRAKKMSTYLCIY